jgi:uncharacterized protein with ParB-like and HNH nuclease domain
MTTILKSMKKFETRMSASVFSRFVLARKNNELNLSPDYQREYVWTEKEQNDFLVAFFSEFPFGNISITVDEEYNIEVVDGKQRLTTLFKFYDGEIGFIFEGNKIFYKDLCDADKRRFSNWTIPTVQLMTDNYKDRVAYFAAINFTGVAQSEAHKEKVMKMLSDI